MSVWEDLCDISRLILLGMLLIGTPIWLVMLGGFWLASQACTSQSEKMGLEHSWGPLQDCMVKVDGAWIPLSSYKLIIKIRP